MTHKVGYYVALQDCFDVLKKVFKIKKKIFKTGLDCSAQRFLRATKYAKTSSMYIL